MGIVQKRVDLRKTEAHRTNGTLRTSTDVWVCRDCRVHTEMSGWLLMSRSWDTDCGTTRPSGGPDR